VIQTQEVGQHRNAHTCCRLLPTLTCSYVAPPSDRDSRPDCQSAAIPNPKVKCGKSDRFEKAEEIIILMCYGHDTVHEGLVTT
jgi:hypothetical protein